MAQAKHHSEYCYWLSVLTLGATLGATLSETFAVARFRARVTNYVRARVNLAPTYLPSFFENINNNEYYYITAYHKINDSFTQAM
jgi:hypothetical protein